MSKKCIKVDKINKINKINKNKIKVNCNKERERNKVL